jgi:hypothetical protein
MFPLPDRLADMLRDIGFSRPLPTLHQRHRRVTWQ